MCVCFVPVLHVLILDASIHPYIHSSSVNDPPSNSPTLIRIYHIPPYARTLSKCTPIIPYTLIEMHPYTLSHSPFGIHPTPRTIGIALLKSHGLSGVALASASLYGAILVAWRAGGGQGLGRCASLGFGFLGLGCYHLSTHRHGSAIRACLFLISSVISIHLSICLSVYLSIYLCILISIIFLSVYISVPTKVPRTHDKEERKEK